MIKKRKVRILKEVRAEEKTPKKVNREFVKVIEEKKLSISDTSDLVIGVSQTSQEADPYVDVRTWVNTDKYNGPTKKGINFNIEFLDNLIDILTEVRDEVENMNK